MSCSRPHRRRLRQCPLGRLEVPSSQWVSALSLLDGREGTGIHRSEPMTRRVLVAAALVLVSVAGAIAVAPSPAGAETITIGNSPDCDHADFTSQAVSTGGYSVTQLPLSYFPPESWLDYDPTHPPPAADSGQVIFYVTSPTFGQVAPDVAVCAYVPPAPASGQPPTVYSFNSLSFTNAPGDPQVTFMLYDTLFVPVGTPICVRAFLNGAPASATSCGTAEWGDENGQETIGTYTPISGTSLPVGALGALGLAVLAGVYFRVRTHMRNRRRVVAD